MALNEQTLTAITNESRRMEARQKLARLQGSADASALLMQRLNTMNTDTQQRIAAAAAELANLEAGAGPGITDEFGPKSSVTQMIEKERWAAKEAVIDYVKANPECSEAEAAAVWNTAGIATHSTFPTVIQDGLVMAQLYRANMLALGLIATNTWEAHRAWIVATDKAEIMGL